MGRAIRLPVGIVEAFGLREGDKVELWIAAMRAVEIVRSVGHEQRQAALARIREPRWTLPPDRQFDRDDANSR